MKDGLSRHTRSINLFLTTTIGGVVLVSLLVGAFTDNFKNFISSTWSHVMNSHAWAKYESAAAEISRLDHKLNKSTDDEVKKGYSSALQDLRFAADSDIPQALFLLGELLCAGREGYIPRDVRDGSLLLQKAAILGETAASVRISSGVCNP